MANTKARKAEEAKEQLETVSNSAPESKFQGDQQVANSTGFKVETGKSNFIPEKHKASGSTLKQEVAASVVKDASYGGSLSGDGMSFAGTRSSGSVGGVLGAANATPVAGQARSTDRISKKLDRNSTKLNFIPSDQVLVEWDESKPLADAATEDQGFNGTYRNEFARTQKTREAVPGGLMFDRSLDLIVKDNIYFGQGQKVTQTGVVTNDDLTITATPNDEGIYGYNNGNNTYTGGTTGNYLLDSVDVYFDQNGKPVYTIYNDTNFGTEVDEHDANKSSAQNKILMNDAELVRETMDSKAGDEKTENWSPLPRAIASPTQMLGFLRDIEAGVGNEVLTAYRKFVTSMSFQLNRAHKDGQNVQSPAMIANLGLNDNLISSELADTYYGTNVQGLFTRENYLHGEAPTMIALYDSVAKYNNKADFLIQPRGYRMHLQTADNNMDPLKVSKLFTQCYDTEEVFSTIDRDYDPMSPICMTDKAAVISRISLNKMGSYVNSNIHYTIHDHGDNSGDAVPSCTIFPAGAVDIIRESGLNIYVITDKDQNGSLEYTTSAGNGFITQHNYFNQWTNGMEILIAAEAPTVSNTKEVLAISNSDLPTLALYLNGNGYTSHRVTISDARVTSVSFKLYHIQGGPCYYKYSDLRNVYVVKIEHPIAKGLDDYFTESIGGKYHSIIVGTNHRYDTENVHINAVHSTMYFSLWSILLCAAVPYIVKARINSFRDVLYYEKYYEYPFSSTLISIGDVLSKAYTNFSYVNYDTELGVKLMTPATALTWMLPELYQQVGYANSRSKVLLPWYTNEKAISYIDGSYIWDDDASSMSFPSIRSGCRLGSLDNLYGMSEKDVRLSLDMISSFKNLNPTLNESMSYKYSSVCDGQLILSVDPDYMLASNIMTLPRELGFFMTAPYGLLTPTYRRYRDDVSVLGTSSFRAYYWTGNNPVETSDQGEQSILATNAVNVNRAQNFTQGWYCVLASGTVPPVDHGFILSASQAFNQDGSLMIGRTSFTPYASLNRHVVGPQDTAVNYMRSSQKFLWTKVQKLPFILSPFDGLYIDNTGATPNGVIINDPWDFCYIFGLGGFRASDYRESVYNREKEVVNQGILFVSDPWISASPIFKEGSVSSGIKVSKGFEL